MGLGPELTPSELHVAVPSAQCTVPARWIGRESKGSVLPRVLIFIGLTLLVHLSFARYSQWRFGSRGYVTEVCPKQQNPRSRSLKLLFTRGFYNDGSLQKPDLISKLKIQINQSTDTKKKIWQTQSPVWRNVARGCSLLWCPHGSTAGFTPLCCSLASAVSAALSSGGQTMSFSLCTLRRQERKSEVSWKPEMESEVSWKQLIFIFLPQTKTAPLLNVGEDVGNRQPCDR